MPETATKLPVSNEKSAGAVDNGWNPFESLRREIDRIFDDFCPSAWRLPTLQSAFGVKLPRAADGWMLNPAFDVVEKDTEYEISAELPGFDESKVEVKLNNHLLTIKGEKSEEKEEKEVNYHLSERRFGSFQRSFQIPDGVDTDKIEATLANGLLKIKLPKTPEAQQAEKTIAIKAA